MRIVRCFGASAVALVVLLLAAASATASVRPFEVQSYSTDMGVSTAVAEERLETQQDGAGIVEQLEETQKGAYAGVWFDSESGEFVVPTLGSQGAVAATLKGASLEGDFRIVPAQFSWGELEAAQGQVNKALMPLIKQGLVQTSLDPSTNQVLITQAQGLDSATRSTIARAAAAQQVPVEVTQASSESLSINLEACKAAPYSVCDLPIRGGVRIQPAGTPFASTPGCTAGFKGIGDVFGNHFILTAGHCYAHGAAEWNSFTSNEANHYLGFVQAANYPGQDNAAINANGTYWDNPWGPGIIANWGVNQEFPISYESSSYLGEGAVCHIGGQSGKSCGTVVGLNISSADQWGGVLNHLTKFQVTCAIDGDSGGPVFSGNVALGLYSGSDALGTEEEYCNHAGYYTEITEDTDSLGVHVAPRIGAQPVAETGSASVSGLHEAAAGGSVDANGLETSYHFDYGPSTGYGSSTSSVGAGSAWGPISVGATLTGLKSLTTYHYRLVAQNSAGVSYGEDRTFTTPDWRPQITMEPTSNRATNGATVNASINPQGSSTTYHFEYGPTTAYGTSIPIPDANIGSGGSPVKVSQNLTALKPETIYHRRLLATNQEGTSVSEDRTFTTLANQPSYDSSFGSTGSGAGQFSRPLGIASDPNGSLYIVDRNNNRIEKFSRSGSFSMHIGVGELIEPRGVAVDSSYRIWVADAGHHRLAEFSSAGVLINEIGANIHSPLGTPSGVAVGREGHVFVTDQSNATVAEYNVPPTGSPTLVNSWSGFTTPANMASGEDGSVFFVDTGQNRVYKIPATGGAPVSLFGTTGSAPGQLNAPYAIAVKPSGTLLVTDRGNNRVEQFSPSGELLASFGSFGSEGGQFSEPSGIALAPRGVLFVSDSNNNRIEHWNQVSAPEAITGGTGVVWGHHTEVGGILNPDGLPTTYYFEYGKTTSYESKTAEGSYPAGFETKSASVELTGLQSQVTYHYRLVASNAEGTTYGGDRTFTTTAIPFYKSSFGSLGTGNGQFNRPLATASDAAGNLWVVDKNNNRLEKFNSKGEYLTQFGSFGAGNGQLNEPRGVALDSAGNVWVADAGNHRIQEFSPTGTYIRQIGPNEKTLLGESRIKIPSGITIADGGHVFITDQGAQNVQEYFPTPNAEGKYYQRSWSGFTTPANMATDAEDDVWVVDAGKNEVFEILGSGNNKPVARFGTTGSAPGQLSAPYAIAVKPSGNLLVSDRGNNRIEEFTPGGQYLQKFGSLGSGSAQFFEPSGIALGLNDTVFIADAGNHRMEIWAFE